MHHLYFSDLNSVMRFVAEAMKRGGIGLCLVPHEDGVTQVCFWDRPAS